VSLNLKPEVKQWLLNYHQVLNLSGPQSSLLPEKGGSATTQTYRLSTEATGLTEIQPLFSANS